MSYHKDKETNQALVRLLDALCEWERNTGRRSTLILVPHVSDEKIVIAQDGKPVLGVSFPGKEPSRVLLDMALREREGE